MSVYCLWIELLPCAHDRGAVDETSSGEVQRGTGVGVAFCAARSDAADRGAAGGACFALGENDGGFARGGMVEGQHGGAYAGRDVQRRQRAGTNVHTPAETAVGRRAKHGDDAVVYVDP